jgi:hypothetical protein
VPAKAKKKAPAKRATIKKAGKKHAKIVEYDDAS